MDVEYLRSAIKLSAVEYIEKPLKLAEVEQAILKSVRAIQEKRALTAVFEQKNALAKQKLAALLRDDVADKDEIARLCSETGFPLNKRYLGLIVRDRAASDSNKIDVEAIVKYWSDNGFAAIGEQRDRRHCFVVIAFESHRNKRLSYFIDLFLARNERYSIALGVEATGLKALPDSCRTAHAALDRAFYSPGSRLLQYEEEQTGSNEHSTGALPEFYKLCKETPEKLAEWMKALLAAFRERRSPAREKVIALLDTIAQTLIDDNRKLLAALESDYGIPTPGSYLRSCESLDEAESFMLAVSSLWQDEKLEACRYSRLVREVMDYIDANYANTNLDLTMIAGHMNLSATYLSKLFKEETGTSIKQYIIDYRIGLAKMLVSSERHKMHTIAELCGFASSSYFVKVFKASTALSPLQYRKKS
jgi:two-component system response regulator YesN